MIAKEYLKILFILLLKYDFRVTYFAEGNSASNQNLLIFKCTVFYRSWMEKESKEKLIITWPVVWGI